MIKLEDLFTKEITKEDILKKIKNKDEYIGLILVKKIDYEDNLCMEGFYEAEIETLYKETEFNIIATRDNDFLCYDVMEKQV